MSVSDTAGRHQSKQGSDEIPLCQARPAIPLKLARVAGGKRMQHRLAEIGMTVGSSFRILSGSPTGPIIIAVRGTRLAIGKGMMSHIFVKPA